MRDARDPLEQLPRRVLIAGVTGVGKTTLAGRVSGIIHAPHTEIDALFHGPNWVPRVEFEQDVDSFTSEAAWVTEWQYTSVRQRLAARADTMVWLDFPARIALWRLIRRTVRRSRHRVELWNGNVEPGLHRMLVDRDNIIWWGLRTQRKLKRSVPAIEREHPHLLVVRLSSQRDVEEWLAQLQRVVG